MSEDRTAYTSGAQQAFRYRDALIRALEDTHRHIEALSGSISRMSEVSSAKARADALVSALITTGVQRDR